VGEGRAWRYERDRLEQARAMAAAHGIPLDGREQQLLGEIGTELRAAHGQGVSAFRVASTGRPMTSPGSRTGCSPGSGLELDSGGTAEGWPMLRSPSAMREGAVLSLGAIELGASVRQAAPLRDRATTSRTHVI
jgi:hypothetical protein